jgi:predicted DNA-binding transcriptional regulator YafY
MRTGGVPEAASDLLARLGRLVALLSRRADKGGSPVSLARLAHQLDTKPWQILKDIRVLAESADDPEGTWLASLTIVQQGDKVEIASRGPYGRPIRFTAEELLALQVALVTEHGTLPLALHELAALAEEPLAHPLAPGPGDEAMVTNLARRALGEQRCLRLLYAGEGTESSRPRTVEIHDLVYVDGAFHLVAWCREVAGWRRFRADRVVDIELLAEVFTPRQDAPRIEHTRDLFRAPVDGVAEVTVRFVPAVARWIAERYPDGEPWLDGSYVVRFKSVSVDWALRLVLQYGPAAEILAPSAYREAMRRAVATP